MGLLDVVRDKLPVRVKPVEDEFSPFNDVEVNEYEGDIPDHDDTQVTHARGNNLDA